MEILIRKKCEHCNGSQIELEKGKWENCHVCQGEGKIYYWQPVELKGNTLIIKPK